MATTDQAILQQCQYVLIEPPDGGQTWPSGLWTREEILSLANQAQDAFLYNTLLLVGIANLTVNIGDHLIALPFDWLRTISAVWRGSDGTITELQRSDTFEADHAIPTWELTNASPMVYMDDDVPGSLLIRIGPAPTVAGVLEILYVPAGTDLNGNGEILVLPDELAHVVKYGVLEGALSKDGRGKDAARAQYCKDRIQLAEEAAKIILKGWA
jgi:hypothetical protein